MSLVKFPSKKKVQKKVTICQMPEKEKVVNKIMTSCKDLHTDPSWIQKRKWNKNSQELNMPKFWHEGKLLDHNLCCCCVQRLYNMEPINMEDYKDTPLWFQELQQDIEHHSAGVGSVLNLCEVLLHDSDACPTDVEHNALQLAMKNLDRRWRNICQQSPDRRSRSV